MKKTAKELQKTLKEQQELNRVLRYIADLDKQIEGASNKLGELTLKQAEEFEDVRKLEQTSLKSMFYKVLGSKEQQIEKERQEYLQVALEYDEAKKTLELLKYERSVLEKKLTDAKVLENKVAKLKKQREKELMKSNSLAGQRLVQIVEGQDELQGINTQIGEAIIAGQQAYNALNQIITLLRRSNNWGHWGQPGRQFNPARYNRHSNIDRAKSQAYQAQQLLRRFEMELNDVYRKQNYQLKFELGSFNNFIHMLFDNLISDWIVQQKIHNAVSSVAAVRDRVKRLLGTLEADNRRSSEDFKRLDREREKLVLGK
ncbi:MAG: hypothetical protein AB8F74_08255 [Saprospiraceae bacterium]